jgi:predicted RND superfamily exporter protein
MKTSSIPSKLEGLVFNNRALVIGFFIIITLGMFYSLSHLHIDAGFSKLLPLEHEYMKTYVEHRQEFGGANRILIGVMSKKGDIFTPEFFELLKNITDDVFFIPGVDRAQVKSIFTPNVRYTEVVEDGIAGGNVIPDDFRPDQEGFARVKQNILKAGIVGRLIANDFSGAIVSAQLMEINPNTGEKLDYVEVAHILENEIRAKYDKKDINDQYDIHIIGFAKVIGDIADGVARVVLFFGVTFLITAVLVYLYTLSFKLTLIPLAASLMAVVWQLGLLTALGFGIDPMGILVPFLIFAIGVSHGVQMVSVAKTRIIDGDDGMTAARTSFQRLLVPGSIALMSDTIGFITILFIKIRIIQELAITASIGVAVIILTNLILIPVLISFLGFNEKYRHRISRQRNYLDPLWKLLARITSPKSAGLTICIAILLLGFGAWKATDVKIGDLHRGVPELRQNSRYNIDTEVISTRFSIGVDIISVIVETIYEGCIDYKIMDTIDRFEWHMRNVEGVQSVVALPDIAKVINAGWNEGSPKWQVLPRNKDVMIQSCAYIPTSSGLLNTDGSVMPVLIFTKDHKAETIERIVSEVKQFRQKNDSDKIKFRLATGSVGVMAATNEEVAASQFPILLYVFLAIIGLCLITFRSIRAMLCIVLPLGLVSLLAYALMSMLEIGLKVSTLPVVALGVGVGVDYGIYIFSRMRTFLSDGLSLFDAYRRTLRVAGMGVMFTGITLAIGVVTWIFSPLKFQADMGILLTFMFFVNMLGAMFLLPALACFLVKPKSDL